MSHKFNPDRAHGTICGGAGPARYFQDGLYFDAHGKVVSGTYVEPTDPDYVIKSKDEQIAKLEAELQAAREAEAANSERAKVIAELEEAGIEFDRRLGIAKLQELLPKNNA